MEITTGKQVKEGNLRACRFWVKTYGEKLRETRQRHGRMGYLIGKYRKLMIGAINEYVRVYNTDYSTYDRVAEYMRSKTQ